MSMFKKSEVNMTTGNIARLLINFSVPLLLGNLFQQFYNVVDTWVVGNYVSDNAFSAVGTVSPILNMFIYAFQGFSTGAGVVIAQYFGAGDFQNVKKTVHTMLIMAFVCCIVFTTAGYALVPTMLGFMKSPPGVYTEQLTYLRIIFLFISFQIIYNMTSAILRAIGDSTRPFIFLVVACLSNIVLDLLFVIKFKMGVAGVAWATIIAQGLSALLCMIVLIRTTSCVKIHAKDLKYEARLGKQIIRMGIPTAIQQCVTGFSNIFVQGYINVFGSSVMGGWTIYHKVDQFVILPQQSVGMAVSTFVGQNLGADNEKRAKDGLKVGTIMTLSVSIVLVALVVVFAGPVSYFFNQNPEIIEYGKYFLRTISPFMLFGCPSFLLISALRGAGNSKIPMAITISCYVIFRQLYLAVISRLFPGQLNLVALSYPIGWMLCAVIVLVYYKKVGFGVKGSIAREGKK